MTKITNDHIHINRILLSTVLAAIISLLGGVGIGFMWGLYHHDIKNGRLNTTRCNQYTVIDASHVSTACGDTIQYNWKALWQDVRVSKSQK